MPFWSKIFNFGKKAINKVVNFGNKGKEWIGKGYKFVRGLPVIGDLVEKGVNKSIPMLGGMSIKGIGKKADKYLGYANKVRDLVNGSGTTPP